MCFGGFMRRPLKIAIVLVGLFFLNGLVFSKDRQVVRVNLEGQSSKIIRKFFRLDPDLLTEHPINGNYEVLLTKKQVDAVRALKIPVTPLIPSTNEYEAHLRAEGYFDHFHSYTQIDSIMHAIADRYPSIAKVYDIGDSWEKTAGLADRDIWAIKISDHVNKEEIREPEVLYMAMHHAREIITPEIMLYWMHYLTDNYGKDSTVTKIVNTRQIWIVPLVNPDGFEYVRNVDMWWRKNRRRNADGSYGVDLNRNYSFKWAYDDIGSSGRPSSNVYRGTAPFSEPETRAIRDLVEAHHFVISLSYHSYGRMFLYPWGYIAEDTPDNPIFKAIADSVTARNGYDAGNVKSGTIYLVNGECDDWMYGEQQSKFKVFGFTPEVGTAFHPDTTEIMPQILRNLQPNIYVALAAEKYSLRPEIRFTPLADREDTHSPILITAEVHPSPFGLDTASIRLYYREAGTDTFASLQLQNIPGSAIYTTSIPAPNRSTTLCYYFSAKDTIPREGLLPRNAPDSLFVVAIGQDRQPPKIEFYALGDQSVFQDSIIFRARVSDNIGVDSVWIAYRVNGGVWHTGQMTRADSTAPFVFSLSTDSLQAGDRMEYAIWAVDASSAHNRARVPVTGFYSFVLRSDYFYSFETAPVFTTNSQSDWQWGVPTSGPGMAFEGKRLWATNLSGDYKNSSDSRLDSPEIDLTQATTAELTFWHWYKMEYSQSTFWDGGNVKISVDGAEFQLIVPKNGYDGKINNRANVLDQQPVFGGPASNGNQWRQEAFDLTPFVGHKIRIRFHFGSDAYVSDAGWYVDDVHVNLVPTSVASQSQSPIPTRFVLEQNYPNPFGLAGNTGASITRIRYGLPRPESVTVAIFNVLGQRVRTFRFLRQAAGFHQINWDGRDESGHLVGNGVYFYSVKAGTFRGGKKMLLFR